MPAKPPDPASLPIGNYIALLNSRPVRWFRAEFEYLETVEAEEISGIFQAALIGPTWLRTFARLVLAVAGLGGWCGKEFLAGGGVNLTYRDGQTRHKLPFQLASVDSALDGRPAAAVRYIACPFPWPFIVDELRWLGAGRILGMTYLNLPVARRFSLPFLLYAN